MTKVTITWEDGTTKDIELSDTAKEAIRFSFNPSGARGVNSLKSLAGAFLSACEDLSNIGEEEDRNADREFAAAKTYMQTASMWAVLGATKRL